MEGTVLMPSKPTQSTDERAVRILRLVRESLLLLQVVISPFLGWWHPWPHYVLI
jgi:hypothetical protein